jgi:hypothetical protein
MMELGLKLAIMSQYAKTEAGLEKLLELASRDEYPGILSMGISYNTFGHRGTSFDLVRRWLLDRDGYLALKTMYTSRLHDAMALIRIMSKDGHEGHADETHSGQYALEEIGISATQSMVKSLTHVVENRAFVRDLIVANEPLPGTGRIGVALLQETMVAGYVEAWPGELVVTGDTRPLLLVEVLDQLVILGQATCVDKAEGRYDVNVEGLSDKLGPLLVDKYGMSEARVSSVVLRLTERLTVRPIQDALVAFIKEDLNFSIREGVYTPVPEGPDTVNPFLTALNNRISQSMPEGPRRVIGSSGRQRYEKRETEPVRHSHLSKLVRDGYVAAFDAFDEGKHSFAQLMTALGGHT